MKKNIFELFAVTALGLESVCARELKDLGIKSQVCKGGVAFYGGLEQLYKANLWLRTASRVLVRLGSFGCKDFPDLYQKALRLPWGRFVKPDTDLQIKASSSRSRLQHTGRIVETVESAAHRALGRATDSGAGLRQLILVRFEDNRCVVSVDSSGPLLHRRGYRHMVGAAPLRETLAAGILMLLDWDARTPLVDPMCGSGTFVVEGALMGMRRAPGTAREFAFMQWPRYRPGLWHVLQTQARSAEQSCLPPLLGYDRDPDVIDAAAGNASRAGVAAVTQFGKAELGEGRFPERPGFIMCNPPYGGRLGRDVRLTGLYRRLGEFYRSSGGVWQGAVLCPVGPLAKSLGEGFDCIGLLNNGGIDVGLYKVSL
ncbi:23S rRNA (2-N-methyl-G2445)-methyltransferase, putative [Syntrophotalea carbinolica DSM 2380]|uniref:23S rRNA (2-N-methyl-G2445)-methyltransferase, putative n=1 Tax=Syntrophotalea carbinolica (strain DSM 2380 / NBRC 103641 / GraBd1) TaxID=338963 RepID=Q3A2B2_SYNC1|nr:class I SAM-dependent RNA methyltransferase [Syntrophotalea carbinolica]ABA89495.1 23S rRNA (2-N-methyl-G2445)-methyltransferase, putative [Syntrophotalea carbinolica DSM 2380]